MYTGELPRDVNRGTCKYSGDSRKRPMWIWCAFGRLPGESIWSLGFSFT